MCDARYVILVRPMPPLENARSHGRPRHRATVKSGPWPRPLEPLQRRLFVRRQVGQGLNGGAAVLSIALVGNAGANLIYESAGMQASLLGFSLESLLIDNDIIGAAQRTIKAIEVTEDSLSLETIRETCLKGPGHFLGSDQTLARMQSEYVYPVIGDRSNPKDWVEQGRPTILDRAIKNTKTILAKHYPRHVSDEVDDAIRAKLPVRLPREAMRPA